MAKDETKGYHHGNLRAALVAETLALAAEQGMADVSLREVARRVGVSPGAVFRHFADKSALMTAVAEEALSLFHARVMKGIAEPPASDPKARFRAAGRAFLEWAVAHPVHFEIISARKEIDFAGSEKLTGLNQEIQQAVASILVEARSQGLLRLDVDPASLQLMARAQVYGLARMYVDGQLPSWGITAPESEGMMEMLLDLFVELVFATAPRMGS
jgi:AcrR family transcriptional regulator